MKKTEINTNNNTNIFKSFLSSKIDSRQLEMKSQQKKPRTHYVKKQTNKQNHKKIKR